MRGAEPELEGNLLGAPGLAGELIDGFVAELDPRTAIVVAALSAKTGV